MGFALSDLNLTTTAFTDGGAIPARYTGEGEDVSPALDWSQAPEGTKAFAVICHDPDAPLVKPGTYGFVHWVLYDVPGSATGLAEGAGDGTSGVNDSGKSGYSGPMPPEGHGPHHYFYWVLALDRELGLQPGLTMWDFLEKAEPSILGMNRIVGVYQR